MRGDEGPLSADELGPAPAEGVFGSVTRTPIYVQVADQLRSAILAKHLVLGQSLPTERELTFRFGVSRTTIREALRILETEGWLSGGTVIADSPDLRRQFELLLDVGSISTLDLVYLRSTLERDAVVKALVVNRREQWDAARTALESMRPDAATDEYVAAYLAFHNAIVEAGGNRIAILSMDAAQRALIPHVAESLVQVAGGPDRRSVLAALQGEHRAVIEALERGDGQKVCDLLDRHYRSFYAHVLLSSSDI